MSKISDYDIWFKPCEKCGIDPGKSVLAKQTKANPNGIKYCHHCGGRLYRDFSERALKPKSTEVHS